MPGSLPLGAHREANASSHWALQPFKGVAELTSAQLGGTGLPWWPSGKASWRRQPHLSCAWGDEEEFEERMRYMPRDLREEWVGGVRRGGDGAGHGVVSKATLGAGTMVWEKVGTHRPRLCSPAWNRHPCA